MQTKVIKVQRSSLIGQFIGSAAEKTKKKIEEARGCIPGGVYSSWTTFTDWPIDDYAKDGGAEVV